MSEKLLMVFHFQVLYLTNSPALRRRLSSGGSTWWTMTGPSSAGPSWTWTSPGSPRTTLSRWRWLTYVLSNSNWNQLFFRRVKSCATSLSRGWSRFSVQPQLSPPTMFSRPRRLSTCHSWRPGGTTTSRGRPTASGEIEGGINSLASSPG